MNRRERRAIASRRRCESISRHSQNPAAATDRQHERLPSRHEPASGRRDNGLNPATMPTGAAKTRHRQPGQRRARQTHTAGCGGPGRGPWRCRSSPRRRPATTRAAPGSLRLPRMARNTTRPAIRRPRSAAAQGGAARRRSSPSPARRPTPQAIAADGQPAGLERVIGEPLTAGIEAVRAWRQQRNEARQEPGDRVARAGQGRPRVHRELPGDERGQDQPHGGIAQPVTQRH